MVFMPVMAFCLIMNPLDVVSFCYSKNYRVIKHRIGSRALSLYGKYIVCDWGHAKDYVRMQWMMLQQDYPEDFVIASGLQH